MSRRYKGGRVSATATTSNVGIYSVNDVFLNENVPAGEAVYTTPGTYTWIAPRGVKYVSAVVIGGGGGGGSSAGGGGGELRWKNNIPVIPGNSYTVEVGNGGTGSPVSPSPGSGSGSGGSPSYFVDTSTIRAFGGSGGYYGGSGASGGSGGVGDGGGNGGRSSTNLIVRAGTGGGGAGGYTGDGGFATPNYTPPAYPGRLIVMDNFSKGKGGGGGGGGEGGTFPAPSSPTGNPFYANGGNGGGTGVYGIGSGGTAGQYNPTGNGSGGGNGSYPIGYGGGGGGGGNGAQYSCGPIIYTASNSGGGGAVRIVWSGGTDRTREFPDKDVGLT